MSSGLLAVLLPLLSGDVTAQAAKLRDDEPAPDALFGEAVAIDGDTAVVGIPADSTVEDRAGSAQVFVRDNGVWVLQAELFANDPHVADNFGASVEVDGDTVFVGAPWAEGRVTNSGKVYVFTRSGTTWTLDSRLFADDGLAADRFGLEVAAQGDTLFVGAPGDDSSRGAAYVFNRSGAIWSQVTTLFPPSSSATSYFGISIALGDVAVIGHPGRRDVYVFSGGGASWTVETVLSASVSDANAGSFGRSVAIAGDTVVVGAPLADAYADQGGAAFVFVRSGTTWSEEAPLVSSDLAGADKFGSAVAITGDTVLVGAPWSNQPGRHDAGAVYRFERQGTTWTQATKMLPHDLATNDRFGTEVEVEGDTILIGVPHDNPAGVDDAGAVYVFEPLCDLGLRVCSPAVPNSSGAPGTIHVIGSELVSDDDLTLIAAQLPLGSNIGYFIMGTGTNTFVPPGSLGPICVSPGLRRYLPPVSNTHQLAGGFDRVIGTTGPVSGAITSGSVWGFQAWHRDSAAGSSNLTDALLVTFL